MSDLRSYLSLVRKSRDLKTVKKLVSKRYEIAAVTSKVDGRHAVLFDNVRGSKFRLVSNLVGTRKRFAQAIGTEPEIIHERMVEAIRTAHPPRIVSRAKFIENRSKNLHRLPIVTHFEKEPGPFITSSLVYAKNPDTCRQNSSFHRLMPIDSTHFSIRMVEGRHLHRCFVDAQNHGEDLKVAITIGVHPAVSIAGAYQHDWGSDEMDIANSLLDNRLALAPTPYSGMNVPAAAEIVMEGRILRDMTHPEMMVEMLQTYDHTRKQPVFELEALYYRNDPIFHDILSGYSEHRLLMGMPIESKLYGQIRAAYPQTRRVSMTNGGCSWLHAVVQIKKRRPTDARRIIHTAFETHRSLKQVTIVDEDIDPDDAEAVEYAMATRFQADRDLVIVRNVRGSSLDPSSDQKNLKTAKMGVDATRPPGKRAEGFEIAKIPGQDRCDTKDYFK